MILYHFAPAHMVAAIRREGLTLGKWPVFAGASVSTFYDCQWLTREKDPKKQSWATRHLVPYSRTAYRLTISIPASHRKKLSKASAHAQRLPIGNDCLISEWAGSDDWYIYRGKIPPKWIVGCHCMEGSDTCP